MIRIILAAIFLMALSLATVEAEKYKYNWRAEDPEQRWVLTSKDAELRYNWKKRKAGPDCWQYVKPEDEQTYNWKTNTPKLEDRWQLAPKENWKYSSE